MIRAKPLIGNPHFLFKHWTSIIQYRNSVGVPSEIVHPRLRQSRLVVKKEPVCSNRFPLISICIDLRSLHIRLWFHLECPRSRLRSQIVIFSFRVSVGSTLYSIPVTERFNLFGKVSAQRLQGSKSYCSSFKVSANHSRDRPDLHFPPCAHGLTSPVPCIFSSLGRLVASPCSGGRRASIFFPGDDDRHQPDRAIERFSSREIEHTQNGKWAES